MKPASRIDLSDVELRANPAYELVLLDRLSPAQREALGALAEDPDLYGVLRERDGGGHRAVQSASCDTALLFLSLERPAKLPAFARRKLGAEGQGAIATLILEGVLEIAAGDGFVSGPAAYSLIYGAPAEPTHEGAVARLSIAALKYGQALGELDPFDLTARLYGYNRVPLSPRWRRALPTPEAIAAHLGLEDGPAAATLQSRFRELPAKGSEAWRVWVPVRRGSARPAGEVLYKLYVSPAPAAMKSAFGAAIAALSSAGARQFKIGRDLGGVLRPDKFVAYFSSFEELGAAAERLRRDLAGCPAQGVPFSGGIDADGLLSWGLDPPARERVLPWEERQSWRLWVTSRLAAALLAARPAQGEVAPWQFAIERLRLEGFDTISWTPSARIWRDAPHAGG